MSAKWARRLNLLQLAAGIGMLIAAGWGGLILLGALPSRTLSLMIPVLVLGIVLSAVAVLGRRVVRSSP